MNDMKKLLSVLSEGLSAKDLIYASVVSDIKATIAAKRIDMGLTSF